MGTAGLVKYLVEDKLRDVGLNRNVLGIPKTIVHHSESARCILVIVGETLRVKELHYGRPRRGLHPYKGRKAIAMHSHHNLLSQMSRCNLVEEKWMNILSSSPRVVFVQRGT